ncbi:MAG: N-acetyl-gamma-glutamyl-phosphate reductase [Pseudomonadota bacterium]
MSAVSKTRVAVLGASGYTGADLLRLLVEHPKVSVELVTAERKAGQAVADTFPHLAGLELPDLVALDQVEWAGIDIDVVFCALPHGTSHQVVRGLFHDHQGNLIDDLLFDDMADRVGAIHGDVRVIDLSADFRIRDIATYSSWYGVAHSAPNLQSLAVYGLTEHARERLPGARLVACPGCYPTAALLALLPLIEQKLIATEDIIIDAKSGVTGAGRGLKEANLFSEVAEGMHAYGVGQHRHMPEIEQELSHAAGLPVVVSFTPHLVPMNRGEFETIYVKLAGAATADKLRDHLRSFYQNAPFVRVLEEGRLPATRNVRGSNIAEIAVMADRPGGRAIILAAIDNLVKGSSGQAIQNLNLMMGWEETLGLRQAPLFP